MRECISHHICDCMQEKMSGLESERDRLRCEIIKYEEMWKEYNNRYTKLYQDREELDAEKQRYDKKYLRLIRDEDQLDDLILERDRLKAKNEELKEKLQINESCISFACASVDGNNVYGCHEAISNVQKIIQENQRLREKLEAPLEDK